MLAEKNLSKKQFQNLHFNLFTAGIFKCFVRLTRMIKLDFHKFVVYTSMYLLFSLPINF